MVTESPLGPLGSKVPCGLWFTRSRGASHAAEESARGQVVATRVGWWWREVILSHIIYKMYSSIDIYVYITYMTIYDMIVYVWEWRYTHKIPQFMWLIRFCWSHACLNRGCWWLSPHSDGRILVDGAWVWDSVAVWQTQCFTAWVWVASWKWLCLVL